MVRGIFQEPSSCQDWKWITILYTAIWISFNWATEKVEAPSSTMHTIIHQMNNAFKTQTYQRYTVNYWNATLQKIKKLWNQQNVLTGPFSLLVMTVLQNYNGFSKKCYTREYNLTTTNVPHLNVSIAYFADDKGGLATRMCSMFSMGWIAWSNACWLSRQRGNRDTRLL